MKPAANIMYLTLTKKKKEVILTIFRWGNWDNLKIIMKIRPTTKQ